MGPAAATIHCLCRPLDVTGRDSRAEWWGFVLGLLTLGMTGGLSLLGLTNGRISDWDRIVGAVLEVAPFPIDALTATSVAIGLGAWFGLSFVAALTRRLHDVGLSGWWTLALLVPGVGLLGIVAMTCRRGGLPNRFDRARASDPAGLGMGGPSLGQTSSRRRKKKRPAQDRRKIVRLYEARMAAATQKTMAARS